jgi:Holliday junction resolvasome RuvABC ATP-dependent DNA helicase subunit
VARKTKDIEATEPAGDGLLIPGAIEPAPKGYTVLARRYRSRSFDELIGQESIARTLQNAISMGRTAHAYLFCGTRGVGKTSMARIFARALNGGCQHPARRGSGRDRDRRRQQPRR